MRIRESQATQKKRVVVKTCLLAAAIGLAACTGEIDGPWSGADAGSQPSRASVPSAPVRTLPGALAPYAPNELLIRLQSRAAPTAGIAAAQAALVYADHGLIELESLDVNPNDTDPGLKRVSVALPADPRGVADRIAEIEADERVVYAEPNYYVEALLLPSDPMFGELWGLQNSGQTGGTAGADIDAPAAWDLTTGSDQILVAVIDTGVDYTHEDLAANMWYREPHG
jgi:subtilisin family serine protease